MTIAEGSLIDIQNFSVNDGDGIRTVIFFAGCRLRCLWCSNPESFTTSNKVIYSARKCIHCGNCQAVCMYGCGIDLNDEENRRKCRSCGRCVAVCPVGSREQLIHTYNVKEVMEVIEKQKIFYRMSGGGVTYSGGEATMQSCFLEALVTACYDKAIHQAMETSGYFDFEQIKGILEKLDVIFIDIKHMDSQRHKYFTGVKNQLILENIEKLGKLSKTLIIRVPLIMGVNGTIKNIMETARYVRTYVPEPKMELLSYHQFGLDKYEALGLPVPSKAYRAPTFEELNEFQQVIQEQGVEVVSYR